MYHLDCDFCDARVEAETVEPVKAQAKTHLKSNHYDELLTELGHEYEGVSCQNDCEYVFPVGVEDVAGLACPDCGHDNLPPLLEQYVYWRIEST